MGTEKYRDSGKAPPAGYIPLVIATRGLAPDGWSVLLSVVAAVAAAVAASTIRVLLNPGPSN